MCGLAFAHDVDPSHAAAADEALGGSEASLPVDVLVCIGVIMVCLTLPFAVMLKLHRQIWNFVLKVTRVCCSRKIVPMAAQRLVPIPPQKPNPD